VNAAETVSFKTVNTWTKPSGLEVTRYHSQQVLLQKQS